MDPGDKVRVLSKVRGGWRAKQYEFLSESAYSILLTNGKYPITINKYDITTGKVEIEKMESEEDEMYNKEPKITKEQLLEECKVLGTGKEAKIKISEKYGTTPGTIDNYIYKYKINKELKLAENKVDVIVDTEKEASATEETFQSNESINTENCSGIPDNLKLMEIRLLALKGKFKYRISENKISICKPEGRSSLVIGLEEVPALIKELQDIKERYI